MNENNQGKKSKQSLFMGMMLLKEHEACALKRDIILQVELLAPEFICRKTSFQKARKIISGK